MMPIAEKLNSYLKWERYYSIFTAGSLRRMRETIKDLDFIIATDHPLTVEGTTSEALRYQRSYWGRGDEGFDYP